MPAPRLTPVQWLICAIAAMGFAFDIYAVLVAPLVVGEQARGVISLQNLDVENAFSDSDVRLAEHPS